jgi:hypothetical protein
MLPETLISCAKLYDHYTNGFTDHCAHIYLPEITILPRRSFRWRTADSVKLDSTLLGSLIASNGDAVGGGSVGSTSLTAVTPGHPDDWDTDEYL